MRTPTNVYRHNVSNKNVGKAALRSFFAPPDEAPPTSELGEVYSGKVPLQTVKNAEKQVVAAANANQVPQIQLEQIDVEAAQRESNQETSVLIPDYITGVKRDNLIIRWKQLVSGQAFTGSFLELYAQKWIDRSKVANIYDCQRDTQRSYQGKTFQYIFGNTDNWQNAPGGRRTIFLKSKWSLTSVNSLPQWAPLKTRAKGENDVEPDIIVCDPNRGHPIVYIVEMKIGNGKKDGGEEHNQLCRVKMLWEIMLHEFEQAETAQGRSAWFTQRRANGVDVSRRRPEIKMLFVGWAAKTNQDVEFNTPARLMGRNGVPVPYYAGNSIPPNWTVLKINGDGFGAVSGIRASYVTKIIQELNWIRAHGFFQAMQEIMQNANIITARNAWLANFGRETRSAVRNRTNFKFITPVKKTTPTNTALRAEAIQRVTNQYAQYEAMVRNLLNNAATYNPAKVNALINRLQAMGAEAQLNNWKVLTNYISQNNSKSRAVPVARSLVAKGVTNANIKKLYGNLRLPVNMNQFLSSIRVPAAAGRGRRR